MPAPVSILHRKYFGGDILIVELFCTDHEFREKLNKILPPNYRLINTQERPDPRDYKIIFAIISKSKNDLDIPFFSKVNIRNAKRRLEAFGYSVSLIKIPTKNK